MGQILVQKGDVAHILGNNSKNLSIMTEKGPNIHFGTGDKGDILNMESHRFPTAKDGKQMAARHLQTGPLE